MGRHSLPCDKNLLTNKAEETVGDYLCGQVRRWLRKDLDFRKNGKQNINIRFGYSFLTMTGLMSAVEAIFSHLRSLFAAPTMAPSIGVMDPTLIAIADVSACLMSILLSSQLSYQLVLNMI